MTDLLGLGGRTGKAFPLAARGGGKAQFSYSDLPADAATVLRASAERIRAKVNGTAIDVGHELLAAKWRLKHGEFTRWVEGECGISRRSAQRMMQAAEWATGKSATVSHLPQAVLYQLSAPSTPAGIRDAALARIEAGEPVFPDAIRAEIARAKAVARQPKRAPQTGVQSGADTPQDQRTLERPDPDEQRNDGRLEALSGFLLEQVADHHRLLTLVHRAGYTPLLIALQDQLGSRLPTEAALDATLPFDGLWSAPATQNEPVLADAASDHRAADEAAASEPSTLEDRNRSPKESVR